MIQYLDDIVKGQPIDIEHIYDDDLLIDLLNHLIDWSENIYNKNIDTLKEKHIFVLLNNKVTREIQQFLHSHKIQMSKSRLLHYYRKFINQHRIEDSAIVRLLLINKPVNDISGIIKFNLQERILYHMIIISLICGSICICMGISAIIY